MVSAYWVFSALLILWGFTFLYFRSYIKRRTSADRILGKFRDEVDQLVAEINEATDRDLSLIEDRINKLRRLLEDADKRIKIQQSESEKRGAEAEAYAALGRRYVVKTPFAAGVPEPGRSERGPDGSSANVKSPEPERIASGAGPVFGELPASQASAAQPRPRFIRSSIQVEPKEAPFAEKVMDLYRGGFSPEIIAAKLGSTIAEVELVIALAEQRMP
jgi:hypothetical protein